MGKGPSVTIKFGTDGWRGVIAEDFTDDNLRIVVHAIARYVARAEKPGSGILVGYDTRFGSERFAQVAAETVVGHRNPCVAFYRCVVRRRRFPCWCDCVVRRLEFRLRRATTLIAGAA